MNTKKTAMVFIADTKGINSMSLLLQYLTNEEKLLVRKKAMPLFIPPMLAQLTTDYFADSDWLYEPKLDGERCLLFKKGKQINLKSRNNISNNISYPTIIETVQSLSLPNCILDGEMVTLERKISNFSKLQALFGVTSAEKVKALNLKVYYYVFDILYYDGYDLTHLPLITRKKLLKTLIPFKSPFRYLAHTRTNGLVYYKNACKKGWEGVMVKNKYSTYVSKRSSNWLKFKCSNEQEFVIGGFTEPGGSRIHFGALLLGYYARKKLMYAGKVGTGFDVNLLTTLGTKLHAIESAKNPFANYNDSMRDVHWVKPILVCEIKFTEWTRDNKLRHPSFLGLRRDKAAKDVKKEVPK